MTTRMEKVAGDVALTARQKATRESQSHLDPEACMRAFQASWPPSGGQQPRNDVLKAVTSAAGPSQGEPDQETWRALVQKAWPQAVDDTRR